VAPLCATRYRARNPRATPLYRLFDAHFDEVRGQWEEMYERRFGFWRGFVDEQVLRYLDCGLFENGFARIRCPDCAEEYLLAFSCKTRELWFTTVSGWSPRTSRRWGGWLGTSCGRRSASREWRGTGWGR
jgi:hypothetical protein